MFEFEPLPKSWEIELERFDLIVVPCEHNRLLFQRHTSTPVAVVPLGVNTKRYARAERAKSSPFVWLYVGADNHRKGTVHIARAWQLYNEKYPREAEDSVLILKMTSRERGAELYSTPIERVYFDYRVLPLDDGYDNRLPTLAALYRYANAFLFPTMGEGFGLTLAEAMASGLPCVFTPWSGPADFIGEEEGYPVQYRMVEAELLDLQSRSLGESWCASAEIDSIVARMHEVFSNYDEALLRGKRASRRIQPYTWEASAERLCAVIQSSLKEVA
jgi:glycosyltransferase involved in cell wall biosynthesis